MGPCGRVEVAQYVEPREAVERSSLRVIEPSGRNEETRELHVELRHVPARVRRSVGPACLKQGRPPLVDPAHREEHLPARRKRIRKPEGLVRFAAQAFGFVTGGQRRRVIALAPEDPGGRTLHVGEPDQIPDRSIQSRRVEIGLERFFVATEARENPSARRESIGFTEFVSPQPGKRNAFFTSPQSLCISAELIRRPGEILDGISPSHRVVDLCEQRFRFGGERETVFELSHLQEDFRE
jgi:hypothetical protein